MIKNIELNNFKSHQKTQLDFSNLTVLCGANGVGKSSALQVLLLLRESYFNKSKFDYLDLKSNPVSIGTAKDALYQSSAKDEITFKVLTDIQELEFGFEIKDLTKTMLQKSNHNFDEKKLEKEPLFSRTCQFISAARLGPQPSYPKDDVVVDVYNQISVIEGKAEHFIHFLQRKKNYEVLKELCLSTIKTTDLFSQVTAWEREISSGVNIVIQDIGNLGYELKYQFNTTSSQGKTNEFKSSNVGFGLSYVMPVIVAILSAPKDSILFIENPEAHLHPNGQAKLAELICLAAQAGIQIIVETHSDHIINGILVQCKNFEVKQSKGISRNNVSIYHFSRDEEKHCTNAEKIKIDDDGHIRYAPKGFFDQFTIDRKRLMGF
jgi:predicted ATPase